MTLSTSYNNQSPKKGSRLPKRLRYLLTGLTVFAILYTLLGFMAAPAIVKHLIPGMFAEHLDLKAAVQDVDVNPYVFSIGLDQFSADTPDGHPLFEFENLHVNFQLLALLKLRFQFKEISLQGLRGHVNILEDGSFNFSPLLETLSAAETNEAEPGELPPIFVENLRIDQARLTFKDLSQSPPYEAVIFPLEFSLNNFSTVADSDNRYRFQAALSTGGSFSGEGDMSLSPVGARGRIRIGEFAIPAAWAYIKDWVRFEITEGSSDLDLEFEAILDDRGPRIGIKNTSMELEGLRVTAKGSQEPVFVLPSFAVQGVSADLRRKTIQIDNVASRDGWLKSWLNPDGTLALLSVFALESFEGRDAIQDEILENTDDALQEWQIKVEEIRLENNALEIEDRTIDEPMRLSLQPIRIELKQFSNHKNARAQVSVMIEDDAGGAVRVTGNSILEPMSADLKVEIDGFALHQFEPYIKSVANIDLKSGAMGLEGRIAYSAQNQKTEPIFRFQGRFGIAELAAVEDPSGKSVFQMHELAINGIDFALEPNRLNVAEVAIRKPETRLSVDPQGNANLKTVLKTGSEGGEEIKRSLLGQIGQALLAQIKGPLPFRIEQIRIEEAAIKTVDRSVQPPFSLDVYPLNVQLTQIDSFADKETIVKIDGVIGGETLLKADGEIEPFSDDRSARMKVTLKNFDITPLSPYAGRYTGWTLKKGRLSLALEYRLSQKNVSGTNEIFLEKLTLGERIDSPDALNLPLNLAIGLMKDRNDNITLLVPVSGNIDDPNFRVGGVLTNTLVNLITSVVSTPFAILGKIAGAASADQLRYVVFPPGGHALAPSEKDQLSKLATALRDRPALQLEIRATADQNVDAQALSVGAEKEDTAAGDASLRDLARQRANTIKATIIEEGKIEPKRVDVAIELIDTTPPGNPVRSILSVTVP